MFVGLNPSTADEYQDDRTVAKCKAYARKWGYPGMIMTNLFAFRATDPKDMRRWAEPVGDMNDFWLDFTARRAKEIVLCWGNHGAYRSRSIRVVSGLLEPYRDKLRCLAITKQDEPGHPLYLPMKSTLQPFDWEAFVLGRPDEGTPCVPYSGGDGHDQ